MSGISYSLFATALGECGIAWRGDLVFASALPEKCAERTAERLVSETGALESEPPHEVQEAVSAIVTLLKGEKVDLGFIKCDFSRVETFQKRVYEAARKIPAGETVTYGDIALELGDKQLSRSVGQALGRNPFPIIVPCHRVVGANNKMTGFSAYGGIATKARMLAIESGGVGQTMGLFDDL